MFFFIVFFGDVNKLIGNDGLIEERYFGGRFG